MRNALLILSLIGRISISDSSEIEQNQSNKLATSSFHELGTIQDQQVYNYADAGSAVYAKQKHMLRKILEQRFLLTACTMIQNEAAYIVEWIEFMRIQGVDRFVIYDDHSTDNITMLKRFYHQRDPTFEIHIFEAIGPNKASISAGLKRQATSFQHCLDNFGATTRWMLVMDVDEFLYSPAFGTVADLLENLSLVEARENRTINRIISLNLNFGTSGQRRRFKYRLVPGKGPVLYQNGCGIQLLTDHVLRGPHEYLERELYNNITDSKGLWVCRLPGYFSPCRHNPGKSLFRPEDVLEAGVHAPAAWRPGGRDSAALFADVPAPRSLLLQGNHYYYRLRTQPSRGRGRGRMRAREHDRENEVPIRRLLLLQVARGRAAQGVPVAHPGARAQLQPDGRAALEPRPRRRPAPAVGRGAGPPDAPARWRGRPVRRRARAAARGSLRLRPTPDGVRVASSVRAHSFRSPGRPP